MVCVLSQQSCHQKKKIEYTLCFKRGNKRYGDKVPPLRETRRFTGETSYKKENFFLFSP